MTRASRRGTGAVALLLAAGTKAFDRDARIESNGLTVTTTDGEVEVDGTVRSKSEHDAAIAAVWKAPGVTSVADKIRVGS
jgi:osmotically-inducible protein OsmY